MTLASFTSAAMFVAKSAAVTTWTYSIALFYLFAGIGIAAYDFLCPNLHLLSVHTGLSDEVIGATFIAFGNASVDIFSAFAALHSDNAVLAMGSIIGAAFFIICVVIGSIAILNPSYIEPKVFIRDAGFLAVATVLLLFVMADGQITVSESIALVALYIVYATIVIKTKSVCTEEEFAHSQRMHLHPEVDDGPMRPSLFGAVEHFSDHGYNGDHTGNRTSDHNSARSPLRYPINDSEVSPCGSPKPSLHLQIPKLALPQQEPLPVVSPVSFKRSSSVSIASSMMTATEAKPLADHLFPAFMDWSDKSFYHKLHTLLLCPVLLVLQLSIPIPQCNDGYTSPNLLTVYAITAPATVFVLVFDYTVNMALCTLLVICLLTIVARTVKVSVLMTALMGFMLSVVWILQLAAIVVDATKVIGAMLGIPKAVLGLTVVAIGNSLGDLVSNISIARNDHCSMALSACFGSPLLLILIGLGGSSALVMAITRRCVIEIEQSQSVIVTCLFLIATLVVLGVLLPMNRWYMSRKLGWICLGIWALNVVVNLFIYSLAAF